LDIVDGVDGAQLNTSLFWVKECGVAHICFWSLLKMHPLEHHL